MVTAEVGPSNGSKRDECDLELRARWAGLERAFVLFPSEVEAAARRAATVVAELDALTGGDPRNEEPAR